MLKRRISLLLACNAQFLIGCFGTPDPPPSPPNTDSARPDHPVASAAATSAPGAGGGEAVAQPGPSPFDFKAFRTTIEPMFETCAAARCHNAPGAGDFAVKFPPGDQDHVDNFNAVTAITNLQNPAISLIYLQATVQHGRGKSRTVDGTQAPALLQWITDAKNNAGNNPNSARAPVDNVNLGGFRSDAMPIDRRSISSQRRVHPRPRPSAAMQ